MGKVERVGAVTESKGYMAGGQVELESAIKF
jgi:hypothetical protein